MDSYWIDRETSRDPGDVIDAAGEPLDRLAAVRYALSASPELQQWYRAEHGIVAADLSYRNIRTYGGQEGRGSIVDAILQDAVSTGILRVATAPRTRGDDPVVI